MNITNPTTFGTPDLTLSTSNSSGTGGALRADDTILVYDTTAVDAITFGQSGSTGSAATASRRDHVHAMVADPSPSEASQAQMEAETSGTLYAPPDLVRYSPGVPKSWVAIIADGTIESPNFNIASVTDTSTGIRVVNFTDDHSTVVYSIVLSVLEDGTLGKRAITDTRAVDAYRIVCRLADHAFADIATGTATLGDQ